MTSSTASDPIPSPDTWRSISRAATHTFHVDPRAVVFYLEKDAVACRPRAKPDRSFRGLPRRLTFASRFDAVARGVAHEMKKWLEHPVHDELVDLRFLSAELEVNLLPCLAGDVAHREAHALEHFANRHETNAHHTFANRSDLSLDEGVRLEQILLDILREPSAGVRERRFESSARDDELADHSHQIIETREIDTHDVGRCRRGSTRR